MKTAVVIPKHGLLGGAESFSYELCERLAEHEGLEIHVFANQWYRGNSPIIFHKLPIIPFPRFIKPISFAYFSRKRIPLHDYDLIHTHAPIFRMDLLTMHGIPHESWIREVRQKSPSLFDRSTSWIEGKGLRGPPIPIVMPVSSLVKGELMKHYDIPASRIRVIHPGVSTERFPLGHREKCRHEIRQRHGLSSNDIVCIFVGMNFEVKRLELVIRGIAGLRKAEGTRVRLKLLVVGKGSVERYRQMAYDLDISDSVVFAGVRHDVERYLLASDFFAMPSVFDTFGLAVLEALAAGLPVIVSRSVGACDLIEEGEQGFILGDNPSPDDFGEKLAALLNAENRMKMGEKAREVALRHTWRHKADELLDCYRMSASEKHNKGERARRPRP